ncbi:MAG TPA: BBE domain-containing protein, partial [Actinocrinis sp.]
GGGNFGVVTSLTFRTLPVPPSTVLHLAWTHARAADLAALIEAWQRWSPPAPDGLAASLLITVPGDPDRPPAAHVFGALLDTESAAHRLLGDLVARCPAAPDSTEVALLPYRRTKARLAELGDDIAEAGPDHVRHTSSRSEFFDRPLPAAAIAALVGNLGRDRRAGQSRELDFSPWGGAYNRTPAPATAFAHRDCLFLLKHAVGVPATAGAEARQEAGDWLAASWSSVRPAGSGRVYPNFPDPGLADWARAYHGANYDRLCRVRARYDPDGFFRFPQAIGSAP